MNQYKFLLMTCALGLTLSTKSLAGTLSVDGNLADWGLFTSTTNPQTWIPQGSQNCTTASNCFLHNGLTIYYAVEDYLGGDGGRVYPGYGGQAYDAEALYVTLDADNLYIALVTGHDPNTKQQGNNYAAGDFALNFWSGAHPDSNYEFGIQTPHQSNNIGLFSTNVYQTTNDNWLKDPFWNTGAVTSLNTTGLTPLGKQAAMSIQPGPAAIGDGPGPHWIYEISVAKSVFGDAFEQNTDLNISWTMNCANDTILVEDDIPTIDEPPVWALLGLTLPAVFWRRRHLSRAGASSFQRW
ncbi:MAG: hypothetical protein H6974_07330 [Gammaproteobacteria bacterium]|nr:hypothetical protein [Gammaproteobacteria bacterium]MCP5196583.1 hypothetical protein [Gammaproteobacteria bacterium]